MIAEPPLGTIVCWFDPNDDLLAVYQRSDTHLEDHEDDNDPRRWFLADGEGRYGPAHLEWPARRDGRLSRPGRAGLERSTRVTGDVRQQLTEALDEAERQAVQASYGMSLDRASEWHAEFADEPDPDGGWQKRWAVLSGAQMVARCPEVSPRFSTFIARWDPATVLRLVEGYREMLDEHREGRPGWRCACSPALAPCRELRRAATFWLDTPEVDR